MDLILEWTKTSSRRDDGRGIWTLGDLAFIAGVLAGLEPHDVAWQLALAANKLRPDLAADA